MTVGEWARSYGVVMARSPDRAARPDRRSPKSHQSGELWGDLRSAPVAWSGDHATTRPEVTAEGKRLVSFGRLICAPGPMVFLVSRRPTRHGEKEGTMSRIMLSLLSGLAVGLASGLSANSSCQPGFPLPTAKEEALYRGQPAGYWLQQLRDRDSAQRQQA